MDEQSFLAAIEESMQESARQMQLLGRPVCSATREEALKQVQMLEEARKAWTNQTKHQ